MKRALLLAAALCAGVSAPAAAREKVLRFGLTGDYPPFAERHPDGTLTGGDITIARRVARAMHARAEFVVTSWQTLEPDFAARKFDVVIGGLTVTPERAALGTYSIPLMDDGKRPLARCADRDRYATIASINQLGVRVEISRGPAIIELAKGWFPAATLTINPVEAMLTQNLLERRSDVWVGDGVVADHMARRYPGKLCATTLTPYTHLTKAWLIQRDPALVAGVNKALTRLRADGSWRRAIEAIR